MDVNYVLQRMQGCRLLWSPLYELWHKTDTIWVTSPSDTCSMQTEDLQTEGMHHSAERHWVIAISFNENRDPTTQTWTSRTQIWDDALTCQSHVPSVIQMSCFPSSQDQTANATKTHHEYHGWIIGNALEIYLPWPCLVYHVYLFMYVLVLECRIIIERRFKLWLNCNFLHLQRRIMK